MNKYQKMFNARVRYFEFNKHEYYALLAVLNNKPSSTETKAFKEYVKHVGGDTFSEVRSEGRHTELTKDEALLVYLKSIAKYDDKETIQNALKQFEEAEDVPLLIDGSLL